MLNSSATLIWVTWHLVWRTFLKFSLVFQCRGESRPAFVINPGKGRVRRLGWTPIFDQIVVRAKRLRGLLRMIRVELDSAAVSLSSMPAGECGSRGGAASPRYGKIYAAGCPQLFAPLTVCLLATWKLFENKSVIYIVLFPRGQIRKKFTCAAKPDML